MRRWQEITDEWERGARLPPLPGKGFATIVNET
jgi:hypothetical protein